MNDHLYHSQGQSLSCTQMLPLCHENWATYAQISITKHKSMLQMFPTLRLSFCITRLSFTNPASNLCRELWFWLEFSFGSTLADNTRDYIWDIILKSIHCIYVKTQVPVRSYQRDHISNHWCGNHVITWYHRDDRYDNCIMIHGDLWWSHRRNFKRDLKLKALFQVLHLEFGSTGKIYFYVNCI